ncbi:MAG: CHAD domain-containing protein, partial [Rhizobiales bacterium]|nr:CHAD domain-containing protein [Hyphomicrobiales bacterium]
PLARTAGARLEKRHRHAIKRGHGFASQTTAERHRVRIALKKLRYACDFLAGLYPAGPARVYLKRLSVLQNDMGIFNDASVAEQVAGQLCAGVPEAVDGARLVKDWHRHRLDELEPHLVKAWSRFAKARPFWRE